MDEGHTDTPLFHLERTVIASCSCRSGQYDSSQPMTTIEYMILPCLWILTTALLCVPYWAGGALGWMILYPYDSYLGIVVAAAVGCAICVPVLRVHMMRRAPFGRRRLEAMMGATLIIPPVSMLLGIALLFGRDEVWKPFLEAGFVAGCLGAVIESGIFAVSLILSAAMRRQKLIQLMQQ